MATKYYCKNENRREAVRNDPVLNGLDYLEVTSADQKTLSLYFLHNLPGESNPVPPAPEPPLTKDNIRIEGGARIKKISIESVGAADNVLTVVVDRAGDFSQYTLSLVSSPADHHPPTGFDPPLSSIQFSFKAGCPGDLDCKAGEPEEEALPESPDIDYLARDYDSFRRVMMDRLSLIMPDWKERNPADMMVATVELLAYAADQLSYYQDAIGTEAYLETARKRISVRRHARLLDYHMHDGCNARAWVHLEVEEGGGADTLMLPAGTKLLTKGAKGETTISPLNLEDILTEENPLVYETKHDITLRSEHNEISFYTWGDTECCLPAGSTKATLVNDPALSLNGSDVLIFEEKISPTKGLEADADPERRHEVRLKKVTHSVDQLTSVPILEIEWFEEDALPFPLCVSSLINKQDGTTELVTASVARGNVVLADHGIRIENQGLVPKTAEPDGRYNPRLDRTGITVAVPYNHSQAETLPASAVLTQDPAEAIPVIALLHEEDLWSAQRDLLASDRFAKEFVAEMESDGTTYLRFGDGTMGDQPEKGFTPSATYRVGNGIAGNAGRETITRVVSDVDGFISVRNPMPATGGRQPETATEARQFAPQAFRTQERAVTEEDYAVKAELHKEVQKAKAHFHWTGSWYTVFITVDRKNGLDVDARFKEDLVRHMEKFRMAGYDIEIREPRLVPLEIVLNVCVQQGHFRSDVKKELLRLLSNGLLTGGQRGFFHPDNFTFGQPVYLSRIYQLAMTVPGVESVEASIFKKWAKNPEGEKEEGFLKPAENEIILLDNDPNFPENGIIEFKMSGGL